MLQVSFMLTIDSGNLGYAALQEARDEEHIIADEITRIDDWFPQQLTTTIIWRRTLKKTNNEELTQHHCSCTIMFSTSIGSQPSKSAKRPSWSTNHTRHTWSWGWPHTWPTWKGLYGRWRYSVLNQLLKALDVVLLISDSFVCVFWIQKKVLQSSYRKFLHERKEQERLGP